MVNGSSTALTNREAVTGIAAAAIVDTPIFNIKDGEYTDAQTISMSTKTAGAVIYYTLDGSSPSESFGIKYDAPFLIGRSSQIKAAAFKTGSVASQIASLNLSIKLPASSSSDFYYKEETTSITIIHYIGTGGHITIPDTIKGKPVVTIGNSALSSNNLTSVVVPDSVTSIKSNSFSGCKSLKSITLSKNISTIESNTFLNCTSLTDIVLPINITSIDNYAFYGCTSLTNIVLPNSVTKIGDYAFSGCKSLKSVTLSDNLTSIGIYAFSGCSGLKKIIIQTKLIILVNMHL